MNSTVDDPFGRRNTNTNGSGITYVDNAGQTHMMTGGILRDSDGRPLAAYDTLNQGINDTVDRWNKSRQISGGSLDAIRTLLRNRGYNVDGMSDEEVMQLYQQTLTSGVPSTDTLQGFMRGGTGVIDNTQKKNTDTSSWTRATAHRKETNT